MRSELRESATMELQRKIRAIANKINPSPGKNPVQHTNSNQGYATLIVMIVVLTIIILFCCFAAPGVRDLCRRYIFRSCQIDDPDRDNASTAAESTTPTIILLPYGRMLVVDRSVFAQLQVDNTGIDFMELSANLIRAQQQQLHHRPHQVAGSLPSVLDSETTSKGCSPSSLGFSPPAYDDIFGDKASDLPPSYSEVSLMFRTSRQSPAAHHNIELCEIASGTAIDKCDTDMNNDNNLNTELDDENARGAIICAMNNGLGDASTSTGQADSDCFFKETSF